MLLMSTHNICFQWKIRKVVHGHPPLSGAMVCYHLGMGQYLFTVMVELVKTKAKGCDFMSICMPLMMWSVNRTKSTEYPILYYSSPGLFSLAEFKISYCPIYLKYSYTLSPYHTCPKIWTSPLYLFTVLALKFEQVHFISLPYLP